MRLTFGISHIVSGLLRPAPGMLRLTLGLFILTLIFVGTPAQAFGGFFGSSTETVKATDGKIILDTAKLEKGGSQHYKYSEGKTSIKFFVVRDNQGTVRAALDACDVCWHEGKGYKLQDGAMLCVNCGQKFALNRIGEARGGCNPHIVTFGLDGDKLTVTTQELLAGSKYFPDNN